MTALSVEFGVGLYNGIICAEATMQCASVVARMIEDHALVLGR